MRERDNLYEIIHKRNAELDSIYKTKTLLTDNLNSLQENYQDTADKLNSTKNKLNEALRTNSQLKNDLKLAQKCVQRETGENLNLSILGVSPCPWRGRAQQITILQNKIAELKMQADLPNTEAGIDQ